MSDNNQLSLSDLGVEAVPTPAEMAERNSHNEVRIDSKSGVEIESAPIPDVIEKAPESSITEEEAPKQVIIKPGMGSGLSGGNIVRDINSIARKPITDPSEKNPIKDTLNNLYEMADQNIDRTKVEILPRIEEGKKAYIQQKWEILEAKAKRNKNLAKKIKEINDLIDTDARFDDIDDYLRHGYILTVVAHDTGTGIDPNFFGKGNEVLQENRRFRSSKDASEEISKAVNNEEEDVNIYDDSVTTSLNKDIPYLEEEPKKKKNVVKEEEPKEDNNKIKLTESEEEEIDDDDESTADLSVQLDEDDEEDMSQNEEFQKQVLSKYKQDIEDALSSDDDDDLSNFAVSNKAIKLSAAIGGQSIRNSVPWGLQYSGNVIEMIPFSGEDLLVLNPSQTDYTTVAGLNSVFSVLYRHIVNPNKPEFDEWLKQTSDADVDCLIFAVYVANFKDTNILSHECQNPKCGNVFIKKYKIDDILVYPNDEVKERFNNILSKNNELTKLYRTKPKAINKDYAISFVTKSLYSTTIEPLSIPKEQREKYAPVLSILPVIDTIYKIDRNARALIPISFGKADTLEKSVLKKVKGVTQVLRKFSPDERSLVISEAAKVSTSLSEDKIEYQIPETICPHCKKVIPARKVTPLDLLFIRAQLPIIAASIQE